MSMRQLQTVTYMCPFYVIWKQIEAAYTYSCNLSGSSAKNWLVFESLTFGPSTNIQPNSLISTAISPQLSE